MEKRQDLGIPYGVANFKTIRTEGLYYVDKTEYLAKLEARDRFVFFVRPRRFGKSLFLDMLRLYYDRNEKANFETLFGGLWIGSHPTPNRNRYLMLKLDFSEVGKGADAPLDQKFDLYLSTMLDLLLSANADLFTAEFAAECKRQPVGAKFDLVVKGARAKGVPAYLVIDEYDNFTNDLIRSAGSDPYRTITHGTGFYRRWFKTFKSSFDRIFMTGVSPVTMDDLTSGFNIAANISQDAAFNAMLGFTEAETLQLYRDFKGVGEYQDGDPETVVRAIKPWYDGYCFAKAKIGKESVFNSDMVLYHLKSMVAEGVPPEDMVDVNISTDYAKLETIVDLQRQAGAKDALPVLKDILRGLPFEIHSSFDIDRIGRQELVPTILHNAGMLVPVKSYQGLIYYSFPNIAEGLSYLYLLNGWNRANDHYIVELKHSKADASDAELAAKADEGIAQLRRYAADPFVPDLAKDTALHLILYQFKGTDLIRLEEIGR